MNQAFGQRFAADYSVGFGTPVYSMHSGTVISWNDATPDRDTRLPSIQVRQVLRMSFNPVKTSNRY